MKKAFLLSVFSLLLAVAHAQQYVTIDQLGDDWTKKNITGVKDGNILTLVTAFNKVWRTAPATDLLKNPVTNDSEGDAYNVVVDRPNGYVSAYELGDDGESFEACVWKRDNGHRLFAYVFQRLVGLSVHQIILFYDYDPVKKTLTPEPNELNRFVASFDSYHPVTYHLPRQGKDVTVKEYFMGWGTAIEHVYRWNGMAPQFSQVKVAKMAEMLDVYTDLYDDLSAFAKYTLYDFDGDGNPELWLSSEDEESQAIYSIVNEDVEMLSATYFKTHFFFHANTIASAGGCGTGCYSTQYVILKNSKPAHTFEDFQEWNLQKEDMDHTYSYDEEEISAKEGGRILKSLGKVKEVKIHFRPLFAGTE